MKKKIVFFAFCIAVFSSCSTNDNVDQNDDFPADGVIRVATTVDVPATRYGQVTDSLILFNLNIVNPVNAAYSYYAYMRKEKLSQTCESYKGADTKEPLIMLWQDNKTPITVAALSAKEYVNQKTFESFSEYSVLSQQWLPDSVRKSDILYLPPTSIDPSNSSNLSSGKLKLSIPHFLSKLKIEMSISFPESSEKPFVQEIRVCGTKIKFSFRASDNKNFTLIGNPIDIRPIDISDYFHPTNPQIYRYECIIVPQTVKTGDLAVSFTIKNKLYIWRSSKDITFTSGCLNTLKMELDQSSVTMKSLSSSKWESGISGNFEF